MGRILEIIYEQRGKIGRQTNLNVVNNYCAGKLNSLYLSSLAATLLRLKYISKESTRNINQLQFILQHEAVPVNCIKTTQPFFMITSTLLIRTLLCSRPFLTRHLSGTLICMPTHRQTRALSQTRRFSRHNVHILLASHLANTFPIA